MKKKLAILTATAMFFGALGLGLLAFPRAADAHRGHLCEINHHDLDRNRECVHTTICIDHSALPAHVDNLRGPAHQYCGPDHEDSSTSPARPATCDTPCSLGGQ